MFTLLVNGFVMKHYLSMIIIASFLVSCAGKTAPQPEDPEMMYKKAQEAYDNEEYARAAKLFSKLEQEFPYSKHTKEGLLKTAYAQFETEEYEEAASTTKRFLELYPGAQNTDYALHLLSLCYYNRISDARRDLATANEAKKYFRELIGRYPESEYAMDARIKLDFVNNQIAAKDMLVGRFYLEQDQIPAAINRFKNVVRKHQTTDHVKEALFRLTESYLILGLQEPAHKAALLLGHNYPDSPWYHDAYALMKETNPNFVKQDLSEEDEKSFWDIF